MNAEEFTARLNALLDARRDWENDPQLQRAALESTECRELLDAYLRVFDGFEQISSLGPFRDLTRRIVIKVRAGMAAEAQQTLPIAGRIASSARWKFTAAAALVACALPLAWYFSSDRPLVGESAARRHHSLDATVAAATEVATLAQAPSHQVGEREAEGVKALVSLARETQEAVGEVVLQLPAAPSASPAALVPADSAPGRLLRGANVMEHVSEGLAPLANSAAGALDFLLEVLPHRDD